MYGNGANGGVHSILPGDSGDDEEEQVENPTPPPQQHTHPPPHLKSPPL